MNFIDKAIGYLSPHWGLERARARLIHESLKDYENREKNRVYEAASPSKRTQWLATGSSANTEIYSSLERLRNRSRDLVRNNPYANKAIQVIVSNTVGTGIIPQVKGKRKGRVEKVSELWKRWAESPLCDVEGRHDLSGLQSLVQRTVAESGECLVRLRRRGSGFPFPIQLQVLEPDFLDSRASRSDEGNRTIQGIEFNQRGERVAYHLFESHPGEIETFRSLSIQSQRIPASDILHVYRVDRPGQVRGVPWSAPVMLKLKDFDGYEDAQLIRQKIAACFSVFIRSLDSGELSLKQKAKKPEQENISVKLAPGTMQYLAPGEDVEFASPPGVQNYSEYSSQVLHAVACGFGITYESMTGDLSRVNFSSARMGWLEFQRNIEQWRWQMLIPQFCNPIWYWFLDAASLMGFMTDGLRASWTPPRREMIDPSKEVRAMMESVRAGFTTLSEVQRELGYVPSELLDEYAQDVEKVGELGLKLSSISQGTRASKPSIETEDGESEATSS